MVYDVSKNHELRQNFYFFLFFVASHRLKGKALKIFVYM